MAQSLAKIYIHIIFHTKNNYPFIKQDVEQDLYAYIGGIIKNCEGIPLQINGTSDHIHILTCLPRTMALAKFIEEIKRSSSKWIKSFGNNYLKFSWQNGYGAFSVSSNNVEIVKKYILNQKEHHKKTTYREEYLLFLQEYNVDYDEKYIWT